MVACLRASALGPLLSDPSVHAFHAPRARVPRSVALARGQQKRFGRRKRKRAPEVGSLIDPRAITVFVCSGVPPAFHSASDLFTRCSSSAFLISALLNDLPKWIFVTRQPSLFYKNIRVINSENFHKFASLEHTIRLFLSVRSLAIRTRQENSRIRLRSRHRKVHFAVFCRTYVIFANRFL